MSESDDTAWRRAEPDSPCVQVCLIHPETRTCLGCRRTAEEIAGWARLAPEARARIMAELPTRPEPRGRRTTRRRRARGGDSPQG